MRRGSSSGHVEKNGQTYPEGKNAIREPSQAAWRKMERAHALLLMARKIPVDFCHGGIGDIDAARAQLGESGVDRLDLIVRVLLDIGA